MLATSFRYLSTVSHDLRSPLSSIFAIYKLLAAGSCGQISQSATEAAASAQFRLEQLLSLVNSILELGKLDAGKLPIAKELTDVNYLIEQAVNDVRHLAESRNIEIEIDASAGTFMLDSERIGQVLRTLLSDAIRFSPDHGKVFVIATFFCQRLRVQVIDQGTPIEEAEQEVMFDRFQQLTQHNKTSRANLALAFCQEIVEEHGGKIGVDSAPQQGNNFWLVLNKPGFPPLRGRCATRRPADDDVLKRQFFLQVSRNLRTQLAFVCDTSTALVDGDYGPLPDMAMQLLKISISSEKRLLSLVDELSDSEIMRSGLPALKLKAEPALSIMKRSADEVEMLVKEKKISTVINVPEDLHVAADANKLVQVGVNLLANAVKFSPAGSVISMSAERKGDLVEFKIEDKGRGIEKSKLKNVFDRYYQVERRDTTCGSGLGLSICKEIVENHGGQIGAESDAGQGSTFFFQIPASQTAHSAESQNHALRLLLRKSALFRLGQ